MSHKWLTGASKVTILADLTKTSHNCPANTLIIFNQHFFFSFLAKDILRIWKSLFTGQVVVFIRIIKMTGFLKLDASPMRKSLLGLQAWGKGGEISRLQRKGHLQGNPDSSYKSKDKIPRILSIHPSSPPLPLSHFHKQYDYGLSSWDSK